MNNGSFFPNFNNQPTDTTLNSMNMQTMNQAPVSEEPATPTLNANINPNVIQFPEIGLDNLTAQTVENTNTEEVSTPPVNLPNIELPGIQEVAAPTPKAEPAPIVEESTAPTSAPEPIIDIPLFANQQVAEEATPSPVETPITTSEIIPTPVENNEVATPPLPIIDTPIFNTENTTPEVPATPVVEAPITPAPQEIPVVPAVEPEPVAPTPENIIQEPTENNVQDNNQEFERVKELLNNNNVEYSAYSNEFGHCIIIEI